MDGYKAHLHNVYGYFISLMPPPICVKEDLRYLMANLVWLKICYPKSTMDVSSSCFFSKKRTMSHDVFAEKSM